jgi:two-component system, cell cycle sensor histidine kinase and response regulator CckA
LYGAGIALALASAGYWALNRFPPHVDDRVYRIGWQHVPPFQYKATDGSPAGLVIDLIRNVAQQRGIRLEWVWHPGSSEGALRNREVDLWPLITITPERQRQKAIYISKPYLQHDHSLIVLAGSSYSQVQDLASASISYVDLPINVQHLRQIFPQARLVVAGSAGEALENVCAQRTDAVYLDEFAAGTALLSGSSCSSRPLRLIPLPMLRSNLGVGSTVEAKAVADEIRSGITASAVEGALGRTLTTGGYLSPRSVDYLNTLLHAERRERWLMIIAGVFFCLLALTALAAHRIRRQRNRIRLTEDALRQSEHKIRLMANSLSEMILAYDMDRRLVFANPAVEQITGYSLLDLQDNDMVRWAHPDDRLRVRVDLDKVFQGGAYRDKEYRVVARDGAIKWLNAAWGPIYDENGQQIGVQRSESDITSRKLAEDAFRESERRFRDLLEGVQFVAIITDLHGAITFCNAHTLTITGWSKDEMIGRPAGEFLHPAFPLQGTGDATSGTSPDGTKPFVEGSLLSKDGTRIWIQWCIAKLRDSAGRAAGFASLGEDVTELRSLRAEAARRESEERFRNLADISPLMVWVSGPDKGFTFFNKGWLAFTGRTLEEELGSGWIANVYPDDRDSCLALYSAAFDARVEFQKEFRKRRADGEYRWVLASGVPRFTSDGEFAGYLGSCTDITDLKHRRDKDVAHQKLETVGTLAGGIAHDFNNLLGGVLAQADLAFENVASGVFPIEPLSKIRNVAIRGSGIVRQLMIYAGHESIASGLVDLSHQIEEVLDLLKIVVSKHIVLETDLVSNLPAVLANPAELQQLLMNLVTNASEAIGKKDGVIVIRTRLAKANVHALAGAGGDHIELTVSDTGCGISRDDRSRIFDPFFTTKATGHGLGLAVVQKVVQGLDGDIQIESELGHGTKFRILLPAHSQKAPPSALPGTRPEAEHQKSDSLVLLVEDEDVLRAPVAKFLSTKGFRVIEATDGNEALKAIRQQKQAIDLVLLDVTVPGAPSGEVLAEIRRISPKTKVVVTSAYGQKIIDATFPAMQLDFFLRKPYQLADLESLLRRLVSVQTRDSTAISRAQ